MLTIYNIVTVEIIVFQETSIVIFIIWVSLTASLCLLKQIDFSHEMNTTDPSLSLVFITSPTKKITNMFRNKREKRRILASNSNNINTSKSLLGCSQELDELKPPSLHFDNIRAASSFVILNFTVITFFLSALLLTP